MRRGFIAVPLVGLLLLGGCAQVKSEGTSKATTPGASAAANSAAGASKTPAVATAADKAVLDGLKIDLSGKAPVVTGKFPQKVSAAVAKVIKPGTGDVIKIGDSVALKSSQIDLSTGKVASETFTTAAQSAPYSLEQFPPEVASLLKDAKMGVVGAFAAPGADATAPSQVIIFQLVKGEPIVPPSKVPPKVVELSTLPKITLGATPTFVKSAAAQPDASSMAIIKAGTGAVVTKGQSLTVKYAGWQWSDGKLFDSSYSRTPQTAEFPIGTGGVIPCWDNALVGQKVGSTVELVCSPQDAYGKVTDGGRPAGALVFLVEIDKAGAAQAAPAAPVTTPAK